jgi:hypothetical protein
MDRRVKLGSYQPCSGIATNVPENSRHGPRLEARKKNVTRLQAVLRRLSADSCVFCSLRPLNVPVGQAPTGTADADRAALQIS